MKTGLFRRHSSLTNASTRNSFSPFSTSSSSATTTATFEYRWIVKQFSVLMMMAAANSATTTPPDPILSQCFGATPMLQLALWPSGENDEYRRHLTCRLVLSKQSDRTKVWVKFRVSLCDFVTGKELYSRAHHGKLLRGTTSSPGSLGWSEYVPHSFLQDPTNGLLVDDQLLLYCNVQILSTTTTTTSSSFSSSSLSSPSKMASLSPLSFISNRLHRQPESSNLSSFSSSSSSSASSSSSSSPSSSPPPSPNPMLTPPLTTTTITYRYAYRWTVKRFLNLLNQSPVIISDDDYDNNIKCINEPGHFVMSPKFGPISTSSSCDDRCRPPPPLPPQFHLRLFPRGRDQHSEHCLSIFVWPNNYNYYRHDKKDMANVTLSRFRISILDRKGVLRYSKENSKSSQQKLFHTGSGHGWSHYIDRAELLNPANGLLSMGNLTVFCEIEINLVHVGANQGNQMVNENNNFKSSMIKRTEETNHHKSNILINKFKRVDHHHQLPAR